MYTLLNRFYPLQTGEARIILILGFLLLGNSLARQIAGIVSISGFLSSGGVNQILIVLAIDYLIVLLVSSGQSLVVDRYARKKLMAAMCLIFMFLFLFLRLMFLLDMPTWLSYAIMYLVAEQQLIFFPLIFWVLANDLCSMSQTKRLFPIISSWSFIGKLLGIGIAAASSFVFLRFQIAIEEVLTLNALIYLMSFLLVVYGLKGYEVRETSQVNETPRETLREGWDFVNNVFSFRYLMFAILALAVVDTIIEFRFLVVSEAAFSGRESYQQFYSLYRLGATLLSFGVQTFLTGKIIARMNLKNVFFIFPAVAAAAVLLMLILPGLSLAVTAMIFLKTVRETVDESSRKSFQALVPEERRGRVSTFMDSYLPAVGTVLACVVTGAIVLVGMVTGRDLSTAYLLVAAGGAVFALWSVWNMRGVYDSSLLNWRLKRRQRGMRDGLLDKLNFTD
jgi:ATP:ADP antiporter, AAA family